MALKKFANLQEFPRKSTRNVRVVFPPLQCSLQTAIKKRDSWEPIQGPVNRWPIKTTILFFFPIVHNAVIFFFYLKGPSQPHLCFCLHARIWLLYFIRSLSNRRKITVKQLKIIKHTFRNTAYSKTIRIRFTLLYKLCLWRFPTGFALPRTCQEKKRKTFFFYFRFSAFFMLSTAEII